METDIRVGTRLLANFISTREYSSIQSRSEQKQSQNPKLRPTRTPHDAIAGVDVVERDGERSILAEIIASCRTQPRSLEDDLGEKCKARSHPPYTALSPTIKRECVVVNREDTCSSYFIAVLRALMELVTLNISPPKMAMSKRTGDGLFVASSAAETMDTEEMGLASVTPEDGLGWGEGDRDSQRKRLLNGAMKLLLELMKDEAETKAGKCTGRGVGKECNDLVWDTLVVVLSDQWSDIRKIGAAYAQSLVAVVGPCEAWELCLKCASACEHALSASDREERDSWKSLHGFLLGMRSAIEGGRKALGSSTETPYSFDRGREDTFESADKRGIQRVVTPSDFAEGVNTGREGQLSSAELAGTFGRDVAWETRTWDAPTWGGKQIAGGLMNATSLPYHKESRRGPEDMHICEREGPFRAERTIRTSPSLPPLPPCLPSEATSSPPPPPPPPSLRPRPLSPSLERTSPHQSPLRLAFACLAHRQGTVREAAIGVMCSMANRRPYLARNLYEKAIDDLERLEFDSDESGDTEDAAGERGRPTGKPSSPQAKNTERKKNVLARGLLCLLEQLVHSIPVENNNVGVTYERLFSVLRCFLGQSDTALRQAATSVVLRIANMMEPSGGRGHAKHQYARVVLWMLVRSWGEQAGTFEMPPPSTTSPGDTRASISFGDRGKECPMASRKGYSSPVGAGWNTPDDEKTSGSWEVRESVLMVYEGVLKSLVERAMNDLVSGGDGGAGREAFDEAVMGAATDEDTAQRNCTILSSGGNAFEATPSLKEILVSIEGQVEAALLEAESLLSRIQAGRNVNNGEEAEVVKPLQGVRSDGGLELRRAGTQLLPSLARAMMWWNPEAIRRACERSVQVGAESSEVEHPSILQLRHRTTLCVASELVRASVRHARHLAEILVVSASGNADFQVPGQLGGTRSATSILCTGNTFVSGPSANIKRDDVSSASVRCGHKQQSSSGGCEPGNECVWVIVEGRERWGGSTDGIADSSVGGEASLLPPPALSPRSNIGRVGRTAPSSGVNGGGVVARAAADARGVAVRIIGDALQLCTDIPLLLAQALAVVPGANANFRHNGDSKPEEGTSHALMSRISVPKKYGTAVADDITRNHSKCQNAIDIQPQRQRFVFTGVIEALVLTRAFHATTRIIAIAPKTADDTTKRLISAQSQSVSVSPVAFDRTRSDGRATTSTLPSLPRDLDEETAIRSMAVCDAASFAVTRQLKVLHGEAFSTTRAARYRRNPVEMPSSSKSGDTACFTTVVTGKHWCCSGDQSRRWPDFDSVGIEDNSGCVDRNVAEEPENRQSFLQRGEPTAGNRSVTTKFIIPFTWGSLAIVQVFPAPEEAVRLDRLLCARIVHALPGYLSSLPPEAGILLVPPMLRWLEARDDGVRWISVKPMDARASLLLSISTALRRRREHKSGARDIQSPHRMSPLHSLSYGDESNPRAAEYLPTTPPNKSTTFTGNVAMLDDLTRNSVTDAGDTQQQQQDAFAVVAAASAVVQVVTTLISEARIGTSLFSLACQVARNSIDLMKEWKDVPLTPVIIGCDDFTGSSIELVEEGAFISPLLHAVADHLLRHYPDTYEETVLDKNGRNEKDRRFPSSPKAYVKGRAEVAPRPSCRPPAEQQGEETVDNGGDKSDDCDAEKGKWDDWDDTDSEDVENSNLPATIAVDPERGAENAASAQEPHTTAGRSAAAVMSAAEAYSAKTPVFSRSPRHETRPDTIATTSSGVFSSSIVGSSSSEESGSVSILPRSQQRAEKSTASAGLEASVDIKAASQTDSLKHQAKKSMPEGDGELRPGANAPGTAAAADAAATTGYTGGDRSSINGGDGTDCIPPALLFLLNNESSTRHRRALLRAWQEQS